MSRILLALATVSLVAWVNQSDVSAPPTDDAELASGAVWPVEIAASNVPAGAHAT